MSDATNSAEDRVFHGGCLCGATQYRVQAPLKLFQYCHCSRCQKITGSAHASNLYIHKEQLTWTKGEDEVQTFHLEGTKYYGSAFCKRCGSNLPWQVQTGNTVVIPAGSLDDAPDLTPAQNIYWASKACWYRSPDNLPAFDTLPPRK